MNRVSAFLRLTLIIITFTLFVLFGGLALIFKQKKLCNFFRKSTAKICAFLFDIRVEHNLVDQDIKSVFFVSNHMSYLDIVAINSFLNTRFTPKSDVKKWPLIRFITDVGNSIYIDRSSIRNSLVSIKKITKSLENGDNIYVFPEGTTSNGKKILPFKSSLFNAVEKTNFNICPVTINYTKINGEPKNNKNIEYIAWFGDKTLFSHLLQVLRLRNSIVTITFHKPVLSSEFSSRKKLTKYCQDLVEKDFK